MLEDARGVLEAGPWAWHYGEARPESRTGAAQRAALYVAGRTKDEPHQTRRSWAARDAAGATAQYAAETLTCALASCMLPCRCPARGAAARRRASGHPHKPLVSLLSESRGCEGIVISPSTFASRLLPPGVLDSRATFARSPRSPDEISRA